MSILGCVSVTKRRYMFFNYNRNKEIAFNITLKHTFNSTIIIIFIKWIEIKYNILI